MQCTPSSLTYVFFAPQTNKLQRRLLPGKDSQIFILSAHVMFDS